MQWDGIRLGLACVAKQNDWPTFVFVCMIGNQMSLLSRIGQLSCGQLSVGSTNVATKHGSRFSFSVQRDQKV